MNVCQLRLSENFSKNFTINFTLLEIFGNLQNFMLQR